MMNKIINSKKKALTMIDIIFATLFVFIMIIVGLKFIFTAKGLDYKSESIDIASIILSNEIELYNSKPSRDMEFEKYFDKDAEIVEKSQASYKLKLKSEKIKDNFDKVYIAVYDEKNDEMILDIDTKVYISEAKR